MNQQFYALFRSGVRGLLLATVVLSVLLVNVGAGFHLASSGPHDHAYDEPCADHAGHGHAGDHGHALDDVANVSDDASTDPDDCGHCHCPTPSSDLPGSIPAIVGSGFTVVTRQPPDARALRGISFQPDPPPVRG